jgi:hypothetical protein
MTETLSRVLRRDKPKAEIIEDMTRTFFMNVSGDEAIISIKPNKMTRTQAQNNLYWSIIEQVREETANTKDAIHDHCRKEFLEVRVEEVAKKPVVVLKSTTSLNTKEMGIYLDEVITWIENDLGIKLNLPNDWKELIS